MFMSEFCAWHGRSALSPVRQREILQGESFMSESFTPRSLTDTINGILSTVRDYYDSEYVYYIEKEQDDIETVYEWCAENVPWQRDRIKLLGSDQQPKWMRQEITARLYRIFHRRSSCRKCRSSRST